MAISFASLSFTTPVASLALLTGGSDGCGRSSSARVVRSPSPARVSPLLRTSFFSSPSTVLSFTTSSFSGLSWGVDLGSGNVIRQKRGVLQVRAAGKDLLCMTKRNRSRKSLARVHGFRRRMRTTRGRAVLQRRRAKGRKVLCTKTSPSSGKRCKRT